MSVIAFMNFKGGVGKSSSLCAVAQLLAVSGYKNLIVDLDPQGNTTRVFGITENRDVDYHGLFCEKASAKEDVEKNIYESTFENTDIIPSSEVLSSLVYDIYEKAKDCRAELFLKHNLDLIKDRYDYIFIDTSPFESYLSRCAVAAADKILTPINMDNFSYEGLMGLIGLVEEINSDYSLDVEFAGVFMARVKNRTTLFRQMHESYEQLLGDKYIPVVIRDCIAVSEANTAFVPLWTYDKRCTAIMDYIELVNYIDLMDNKHFRKLIDKRKVKG